MLTTGNLRKISHEAIYKYIYSPEAKNLKLFECLPWKRKRRQQKHGRISNRSHIPNKISIHDRPNEIETRSTFGHYEGDTIVGKQSEDPVIHTPVERMTRFLHARVIPDKTAMSTCAAQKAIFTKLTVLSTTNDNGLEFSEHETLEAETGVVSYFADPYASWQRGTMNITMDSSGDTSPRRPASSNSLKTIWMIWSGRSTTDLGSVSGLRHHSSCFI